MSNWWPFFNQFRFVPRTCSSQSTPWLMMPIERLVNIPRRITSLFQRGNQGQHLSGIAIPQCQARWSNVQYDSQDTIPYCIGWQKTTSRNLIPHISCATHSLQTWLIMIPIFYAQNYDVISSKMCAQWGLQNCTCTSKITMVDFL
jgi:hypothetical protein